MIAGLRAHAAASGEKARSGRARTWEPRPGSEWGENAPQTVMHWYDFLCPFCYIAQHRNEVLIGHGLAVLELPFQAHPRIPLGGIPAGPRDGPVYAMIEEEARQAGLPLNWPSRLPDTKRALAAAEWVRRNQPVAFPQMRKGLFEAHFALGQDIEAPVVINRVAGDAGVDLARVEAAFTFNSATAAVKEAETVGRRFGVRGTPAWLFGDALVSGLLPAVAFERLACRIVDRH